MDRRIYIWAASLLIVAVLGSVWVWREFFETYHLATVEPRVLYRDGMRSLREFETAVGKVQPAVVVSLVDANEQRQEPFCREVDYCRRSKIRFASISVPLGGWPTTKDVKQFLEVAQNSHLRPVLVHCAQGVRRTGMMVAAYQMRVLGWDKEKTKKAILTFGHSERSIGDVKKFIDIYDPKTGRVREALLMSVE